MFDPVFAWLTPTQPAIRLMSCGAAIRAAGVGRKPLQRNRASAMALAREMGVLTELDVAGPVPGTQMCCNSIVAVVRKRMT